MLFWSRADSSALPEDGREADLGQWGKLHETVRDHEPGHEKAQQGQLEIVQGTGQAWRESVYAAGRRIFDFLFALTALVVSAPLMIAISLAIRTTSPGPVMFRQRRVGLRGHPFTCLKFRTMVMDADQVLEDLLAANEDLKHEFEQMYKLTEDPRVTRIGRILRKTSLDELPQFWNVLKGQMSVVGPRPLVSDETERYGHDLPVVLSVRPGITGLWQVSGRNDTTYEERIELDRSYATHKNLWLDLRIILKTVGVMFKDSNGAY